MKLSAAKVDALHADLGPVAAKVNELAGKHGVSASTIVRHILLLPVVIPALPEWNRRVGGAR